MNITQIETNIQELTKAVNPVSFIYDLLLAYGLPKASITRLQQGGLNLSKVEGEIAWKKKLFFKAAIEIDLHLLIDEVTKDEKTMKHDPRFVVVTDFETLLAIDRKTNDSLDIAVADLTKQFDFFLPWAGMEKTQHQNENPADVKAAERMAKLFDEIKKDYTADSTEDVHNLNVFLTRLLFCFFAEDTGIFEESLFTNALSNHTQADGSDLNTYFEKLFEVMNTEPKKRQNLPAYLDAFPYVNGGLFRDYHATPFFNRRSRQMAIDMGDLDWKAINPDIFGSMIQAVITPEHRGSLGMHYTSVPNIMKVMEPLFLNELYEEFEASKGNLKRLKALLLRLWTIKIFDPACGSGNFLIIAYKELRKLEMLIFKEIDRINQTYSNQFSDIQLSNFYGIELDDFAHEVAILSLWLAEHQMNQAFFTEFGRTKPALPLHETGNIVQGNACHLDWETVCPKEYGDEIYILGNPPYLGSSMQSAEQKADMAFVFKGINGYKNLDYIACWFLKGADFIQNQNAQFAFVSTNSICQGEQVALLWPSIFKRELEIGFAHTSFKWVNNAKANAGVTVIIVGLRNDTEKKQKFLFNDNRKVLVNNINAYLAQGQNIIVEKRSSLISEFPEMVLGNAPKDGGNLLLTNDEKKDFLVSGIPSKLIKKYIGADDLINSLERYCLWLTADDIEGFITNQLLNDRLQKVSKMRSESPKKATREFSKKPFRFIEIRHNENTNSIIVPSVSSSRRRYLPCGFLDNNYIVSNSAQVIYTKEVYVFSILSSLIHLTWVRAVAGYLKTDYRYSSVLCYNTFPFPPISENQKLELEQHVYRILEERELHSEKTLAQLYDPDKMPEGLREAHRQNDLAVERCYRSKPFESDEERLEYLFKLYEQMILEEKISNGEMNFDGSKPKKTRKR